MAKRKSGGAPKVRKAKEKKAVKASVPHPEYLNALIDEALDTASSISSKNGALGSRLRIAEKQAGLNRVAFGMLKRLRGLDDEKRGPAVASLLLGLHDTGLIDDAGDLFLRPPSLTQWADEMHGKFCHSDEEGVPADGGDEKPVMDSTTAGKKTAGVSQPETIKDTVAAGDAHIKRVLDEEKPAPGIRGDQLAEHLKRQAH